MEKKKKKKRTPKKGSVGGMVVKLAVVAALFAGSGWWLFASDSDSAIRKTCLDKLSLLVDRVDQVSQAWGSRPAAGSEKKPGAKTESKPATGPVITHPKTEAKTAPPIGASKPVPSDPKASGPAPERAPTTPRAPEVDVTDKDQEELRNLFKDLE